MEPKTQQPRLPKVRLEDEPISNTTPSTTKEVLPSSLDNKITEKMESEVDEAIGDVGRRKEYREALLRAGVNMEFLVQHLKNVALNGEKDSDKIKALQVLLKSLGVDKTSSKEEETSGTWEDALLNEGNKAEDTVEEYNVVQPEIPESAKKKRDDDNKVTGGIYE